MPKLKEGKSSFINLNQVHKISRLIYILWLVIEINQRNDSKEQFNEFQFAENIKYKMKNSTVN